MVSLPGLRVIGAGLPRTGTNSLKAGLERLFDEPCYHMYELMPRREIDGGLWSQALDGDLDKLDEVLADWGSAVDWPASLFWRELADRHPSALVVLSHRGDADTWWASVDRTVWPAMRQALAKFPEVGAFNDQMLAKAGFGDDWAEQAPAKARYNSHIAEVVDTIPAERLLMWEPRQGWEPLCAALGVAVPDEDFAHVNDSASFAERMEARGIDLDT